MTAHQMDALIGYSGVIAIFLLCVYFGTTIATERACLRAGYPDYRVSFPLERYCVKRVDQSDVVVPLSRTVIE